MKKTRNLLIILLLSALLIVVLTSQVKANYGECTEDIEGLRLILGEENLESPKSASDKIVKLKKDIKLTERNAFCRILCRF